MKEDDYKKWLTTFRNSCRIYLKEREQFEQLAKKWRDLREAPEREQDLFNFLKEDVEFVESVFREIEKTGGEDLRQIIWELYVENRKQTLVAASHGLTRRQIQYSTDKLLKEVYENA